MGFSALDYLVLALYLVGTALFGTLLGRGQKTTTDYFLGGKQMSGWAICISIVATETSTLTFIGAPAIAYSGNLTFLQLAAGYLLGKLLVSLVLIPGYFRGELQTAYELLHYRFGGKVRVLAAALFQLTRALADGIRLFATGLVLAVVLQISDVWAVVIIGVITIFYTFYGGMSAVVWNDVLQWVIYVAGGLLVAFTIWQALPGGWESVEAAAEAGHKLQVLDWSWDLTRTYTFWSGLLGGAFLTFSTHGTDQMMVQRYLACGRPRTSQLALLASGVIVFAQFVLFLSLGILLYAFYQHFPLDRELTQTDRILAIFIVEELSPGLSGLIVAAIFAAAMSTLSSSLNSLASSLVHDFYRNWSRSPGSESRLLRLSRFCTLGWGVLLVGIAILARNAEASVLENALTITSIPMGSILGVFLLGVWFPRIREKAALAGMSAGILVVFLLALLGISGRPLVAWTWYVLVGTGATLAAGIVASRLERSASPPKAR